MLKYLDNLGKHETWVNTLYFGDNLDVLKELCKTYPNGLVDLIYIDPPFNSNRNYNVLFESIEMNDIQAQKEAFKDTWANVEYSHSLNEIQKLNLSLFSFLEHLDQVVSKKVISYLVTMGIRLYYIHKILKDTASLYLHCDPTMSHYLKILLDLIFGEINFRNEITSQRTKSRKTSQFKDKKYFVSSDILFFYVKSKSYFFDSTVIKIPFTEEEIQKRYPQKDERGRYNEGPIFRSMSMGVRPNLCYEYKKIKNPTPAGWKVSKKKLIEIDRSGNLGWNKKGQPFRKWRPEHTRGFLVSNVWTDIEQTSIVERLGYPTQKPLELVRRILLASSKKGDLVADFFCGCGTTIIACEELERRWLGADISHIATGLIERRLNRSFKELKPYSVEGIPKDIASAKQLAEGTQKGRIKFQDWIIENKLGGIPQEKKSSDGGWDGYLTLSIPNQRTDTLALIEVKSGKANIQQLRAFIGVVKKNELAQMGIFICFEEYVTKGMQFEANSHGYYLEELFANRYSKIQIITVEDLLANKGSQILDIQINLKTYKPAKELKNPIQRETKLKTQKKKEIKKILETELDGFTKT